MDLPLLPLLLDRAPPGLRRALRQEGVPHAAWADAPRAGRFVLCDVSRHSPPSLIPGQTAIDVRDLAADKTDFSLLLDERSARRGWQLGPLLATEEVARVHKREVRRRLMRGLQAAVEAAGGVWLRLAAFPHPYRSAFNFRFDHDEFVPDDFSSVLQAIEGYEESTTHYVCASTHAGQSAAMSRLRGLDVGSHGWWHHTYRDSADNLANIRRGVDALADAGLAPNGFAAPHGRWNRGLAAALDALGISHSSEFAYCYDDWPCEPAAGGALQLPIHPVCLGIALEAARRQCPHVASEAVAAWVSEHFRRVIAAKHRAGEPIFLYGHLDGRLGRHPSALRDTLAAVGALPDVWRTTQTRFAAWWRARLLARVTVERHGEKLCVTVADSPTDHTLALECWRGDGAAAVPLDRSSIRFQPAALEYETRPTDASPPGMPTSEAPDLRQRVRQLLDWERVTPIDELRGRTIRGWLKKSLRHWRDRAALDAQSTPHA